MGHYWHQIDVHNIFPTRTGINELAKRGRLISISDCPTSTLKFNISQVYENSSKHNYVLDSLDYIDDFIHMRENPKEIHLYATRQDLVIGDSDKDIDGAIIADCRYIRVAKYSSRSKETDLWDLVKHTF
ncbi:MAG: hypothetical protein ACI8Y7_000161 [Candidatus Woesearchaeota archaeon]|jgi:hypothetical protein